MTRLENILFSLKKILGTVLLGGFVQFCIAAPQPPILECETQECQSSTNTGGYDLSGFNIPFGYSWPTAPTIVSSATVTPATLSANNVSGRQITLSAGDYGNVTISNSDQEWIMQDGALINTLTISSSAQRIVIKGETPRVGRIGNFAGNSSGGNSDILIDGIYQINGLYSGTYEVQNSFYGDRVAIINSSLNSHGYAVRSFPSADGALTNFILAGNYIRQDSGIPVQAPIGVQLMRLKSPDQYIIVGNYMETMTGSLGLRVHSDDYSSRDGYIANNIISSTNSQVYSLMFIAPAGQTGTAQSMSNILIEDNTVYNRSGGEPLRATSTPPQAREAQNVILRNNTAYTSGNWIASQPDWAISGNVSLPYQSPPSSLSVLGF